MPKHIKVIPGEQELTGRQGAFIKEYLIDLDGTKAAIRAGYSPRTAGSQATALLRHPKINQVIQKEMDARAARTDVDTAWVLRNLKQVVQRCLQQIPVLDKKGRPIGQWKFDSGGANRGLELLGRHLRTWQDSVPSAGDTTLIQIFKQEITQRYEIGRGLPAPKPETFPKYELPPTPEPEQG